MRQTLKDYRNLGFGVLFTLFFVFLDQWTKHLAVWRLKDKPSISIIPGVFELFYLENRGAAFGILQGQKSFLIIMTVTALLILFYLYTRIPEKPRYRYLRLILILLISGAIGNFIDRCTQDYVIDFFYFSLIDFPVFNVADIYVTVSACLLAVLFFFYYKEEEIDALFQQFAFWKKKDK